MDKLRINFLLALNVYFDGPSIDFLGSRKPAHKSINMAFTFVAFSPKRTENPFVIQLIHDTNTISNAQTFTDLVNGIQAGGTVRVRSARMECTIGEWSFANFKTRNLR